MTLVRSRAPLRLGLAGGGTDVSPFCDQHGGYVLNATIDRYAYTCLRTLGKHSSAKFTASDQKTSEHFMPSDDLQVEGELHLHRAVYCRMMDEFNGGKKLPVDMSTYCDAPPGSGLGSSSTLVVSMVKAFVELMNLPLDDYDIARLAFQIEREDCGLKGGRQDQYSATFGGINFMEFSAEDKTIVNPLRIKNWIVCELEASLILYFTGVSRESAKIIADQSQNISGGVKSSLEAMHAIKREALIMKESLLKGDFDEFVKSMTRGWTAKKQSAKTVSNSEIDKVYDAAIGAGALAGKVSGAGGGGFMLIFAPNEKRMDVVRALDKFDGQVSNCHFTQQGCQAWRP